MMRWQTKIQKRIGINARFLALFVCIKRKVATMLKTIFSASKKREAQKQPLDYEQKHWHKYDWEKWTNDNKDNWN